MPMKIKKIRDYIPSYAYRSPYYNSTWISGADKSVTKTDLVSVVDIRAIGFNNLQIHAMASSSQYKLNVHGQQLFSSTTSSATVVFWTFDSLNNPINVTQFTYDTNISAQLTSLETLLANIRNGSYAGKHFSLLMFGSQQISSNMYTQLSMMGDMVARVYSGQMTYVGVGYSGKINDSMLNGVNEVGGVSQVYLNGINVALNKPALVGAIGSTPSQAASNVTESSSPAYYYTMPTTNMFMEIDLGGTLM